MSSRHQHHTASSRPVVNQNSNRAAALLVCLLLFFLYVRPQDTFLTGLRSAHIPGILAGLCAGMMARGMMAFDAACLASYVNGKAGEILFERRGYSSTASDLLDAISIVV